MGIIKGFEGLKEAINKSTEIFKLKSGEAKQVRILTPADEIISVYEHTEQINGSWKTITCLGKNECPMCQAGLKASFKSYLAVLDRTDGKVKIFKASKTVAKQLVGLIEEYGDLSARDFKILRQGEKLDTTYQFFPKDPSPEDLSAYELPDVEQLVQPMPREDIIMLMNTGVQAQESPAVGGDATTEYPF